MEITILLSKLFGVYMIIGGAAIMIRQRYFIPVVGAFVEERLTRLVVAIFELLGGLLIVLTHNYWTNLPEAIVSFFGWAMLLEGTAYMLLPDEVVEKIVRYFNRPVWYTAGGLFSILLGIYLAGSGFGYL